jgi:2-polyprenyl-3-methyl-5-hydroxy-6-metoxy-1,4-benzoquinol methylase
MAASSECLELADSPKLLDINEKQKTSYCYPLWLRDEQIRLAIERKLPRLEPYEGKLRRARIAVVCFGPSLADTWEKVKQFKYVISCSGSHKFLVDRGIIPTWHVEVDPRPHKVGLMGQPQQGTQYLIASTCCPAVFNHLAMFHVKLWHVFDNDEEAKRVLPAGEWALLGGCDVGLRAMAIARFLGFTNLHIFGKDGCEGRTGKHAAEHPNQAPPQSCAVEYEGQTYYTTPSFLEAAKQTFHELDQMPDVRATFYGDGLVQAMAKSYKPKLVPGKKVVLGQSKPELISAEYRQLNEQLHADNLAYGVGGERHAKVVLKLCEALKTKNVLDYGCGKGRLGRVIPWQIAEYDPAVPGKTESPKPADIVICTDVLEHIEPDRLVYVLDDIRRCTRLVAYITINTGPAQKVLADGRNAHLIQKGQDWWHKQLSQFFEVGKITKKGPELHCVLGQKPQIKRAA